MAMRVLLALVAAIGVLAAGAGAARAAPKVYRADLDGVIGPASAHYVETAIAKAEAGGGEALILQMNTPGGLSTSMRTIVQSILAARLPVIGFVAPSGGHAASAGTFILYATHIAAMAPGTNIGAASPVSIGGGPLPMPSASPSTVEDAKAMNDAVALITGLAQMRGRNAAWAESAVRSAQALTAADALKNHVIELIAPDVPHLLLELDGRQVNVAGAPMTLHTAHAQIVPLYPSLVTKALAVLADPNIALILLMIGVYGLIFEFMQPGLVAPGVAGAICIVLGLYALDQLPLNYAGAAMVAIGFALIAIEAFYPNYGILGLGGVVSFGIGAAMLVETNIPAFQISPVLVAALTGVCGFFLLALVAMALRSQLRRKASGVDHIAAETAVVMDWRNGAGHVWAQGERWSAQGEPDLAPGQNVKVVGRQALRLQVTAAKGRQ